MATAMAAAQAKAVRPGDEALGCAAIEKELIASMTDPAIQAYAAKSAAAAQLPRGAIGRGATTPQAAAATAGAQSAQLAQLQDPSAQLAMMTTVMPQMMRSQRLVGLAMAKGCTSLEAAAKQTPVQDRRDQR